MKSLLEVFLQRKLDVPSWARYLKPVEPVESIEGMYHLADGSLGYICELEGINVEGRNPDEVSEQLSVALAGLPEKYSYQILCFSISGCKKVREVAETGEFRIKAVREYMKRKVEHHDRAVAAGGFVKDSLTRFAPRTIRRFLTVKENGSYTRRPGDFKRVIEEFSRDVKRISTSLGVLTRVTPIGCADLVEIMYRLLNPLRSVKIPPPEYTGGDMRRYMIFSSVENGKYIKSDGYVFRVISLGALPVKKDEERDMYYTPANAVMQETANYMSLTDICTSLLYTINFRLLSSSSATAKLESKRMMLKKHRINVLTGADAIDKEIQDEEVSKMLTELYRGSVPVSLSAHIVLPLQEEEHEIKTEEVVTYLNTAVRASAFKENVIDDVVFFMSLPFGYDATVHKDQFIERNIECTVGNLADISPLYRYGGGVISPLGAIYYTRRGELFTVDLFDRQTASSSAHCLITGKTGSGKSVLCCDAIMQWLRQPARVLVIDKEISYRGICRMVGGQYLRFEGIPDVKIDPFHGTLDEDHIAQIVNILALMVAGSHAQITVEERSYISEAVVNTAKSGGRSISAVVNYLNSLNDEKARSIARRLYMYHGDGQYARFVEGARPNLDFHSDMILIELAEVDKYLDLQSVLVSLLLNYTVEYIKKVPGRKYIILDEVHTLLTNEVAVQVLVNATKTYRKYGCSVIFVTQQLEDFKHVIRAMNMAKNCPNLILLYQDYREILENASDLGLTEDQLEVYRSIRKYPNFTEALFKMENWTAVGRITIDPVSYWISTSAEDDRHFLENLIKEKEMSYEEAVRYAAEKYPYGVPSKKI
jgi:hypothetical protein